MSAIERIIRNVVKVFVLLVWGVIGFITWIPLLFRSVAVYSGTLVQVAFVQGGDLGPAQRALDFAIRYYSRGFQKISQSFAATNPHGAASVPIGQTFAQFQWSVVLKELAWTVAFWGAIALVV